MKTFLEFQQFKQAQRKITMLTAYDTWSAKLLAQTQVDALLVGDSCAMVMHGAADTLAATPEMMALHTRAVRKGAPDLFIVGDLPFLAYRSSREKAIDCVLAVMQAGAQAVKLEGAAGNLELVRHLVESGVPVMGHLGLTPQSIHALGGFRVQGRSESQQEQILQAALSLQEAGCFSLVLECVPSALAERITAALTIPTIGIGAGPHTDGQILVLQDMLGAQSDFKPKFVRSFGQIGQAIQGAVDDYVQAVREVAFPAPQECYQ